MTESIWTSDHEQHIHKKYVYKNTRVTTCLWKVNVALVLHWINLLLLQLLKYRMRKKL